MSHSQSIDHCTESRETHFIQEAFDDFQKHFLNRPNCRVSGICPEEPRVHVGYSGGVEGGGPIQPELF